MYDDALNTVPSCSCFNKTNTRDSIAFSAFRAPILHGDCSISRFCCRFKYTIACVQATTVDPPIGFHPARPRVTTKMFIVSRPSRVQVQVQSAVIADDRRPTFVQSSVLEFRQLRFLFTQHGRKESGVHHTTVLYHNNIIIRRPRDNRSRAIICCY